ncbi:MAG: hypothetical protein H7832_05485 [Magnetococcus sp. DMHC-6]
MAPPPTPTGYDDDGEPYWRIDIMAKHLGIPEEELQDTALEVYDRWGEHAGVMETSLLNRIH